jgi:hypothetical protein
MEFDGLGYLAIAIVCVGLEFGLMRLGIPTGDIITGVIMWWGFFAFWSYRKGEEPRQALKSGWDRYWAYFGSAMVVAFIVAAPFIYFGHEQAGPMGFVFGAVAYIATLAAVYSYRNKDQEK